MEHPSLVEAAAVFAAVDAYVRAKGEAPPEVSDLKLHLAELKLSIDRVEAVTT